MVRRAERQPAKGVCLECAEDIRQLHRMERTKLRLARARYGALKAIDISVLACCCDHRRFSADRTSQNDVPRGLVHSRRTMNQNFRHV